MAETEKFLIYVIKWLKGAEQPDYQCGVFVLTEDKQFIPTPPSMFTSLEQTLEFVKNNFMSFRVSILAMGFDETDKNNLEKFAQSNPFIIGKKYLVRPTGKKMDGTPYKVFLVDSHVEDIRTLKQLMLDEHFEIISMARNPQNAMKFFKTNYKHIDLVFTEIYLGLEDMFEAIKEMRDLSPNVKIITMAWAVSKTDIEKLIPLKIDRFMIKPVVREKLLEAMKIVSKDF